VIGATERILASSVTPMLLLIGELSDRTGRTIALRYYASRPHMRTGYQSAVLRSILLRYA
jgi:hypothetical protein